MLEPEAVQQPRPVVLVLQEVGELGDADPQGTGAVAPDPQRGLLGHDPAREHRRRGLAQQLGDLLLEPRDRAPLGVHVPLVDAELLGRLRNCSHRLGRRLPRGPEDVALAGPGGLPEAFDDLAHEVQRVRSRPARPVS